MSLDELLIHTDCEMRSARANHVTPKSQRPVAHPPVRASLWSVTKALRLSLAKVFIQALSGCHGEVQLSCHLTALKLCCRGHIPPRAVQPDRLLRQRHAACARLTCVFDRLSDGLVCSNGIISSKLAGKLRYLDST